MVREAIAVCIEDLEVHGEPVPESDAVRTVTTAVVDVAA
jgi:predicted RNase H-like HicB family nuclease